MCVLAVFDSPPRRRWLRVSGAEVGDGMGVRCNGAATVNTHDATRPSKGDHHNVDQLEKLSELQQERAIQLIESHACGDIETQLATMEDALDRAMRATTKYFLAWENDGAGERTLWRRVQRRRQ